MTELIEKLKERILEERQHDAINTATTASLLAIVAQMKAEDEATKARSASNAPDLESREFFDRMQQYRISPIEDEQRTIKAFEAVKEWIKNNCGGLMAEEELPNLHAKEFFDLMQRYGAFILQYKVAPKENQQKAVGIYLEISQWFRSRILFGKNLKRWVPTSERQPTKSDYYFILRDGIKPEEVRDAKIAVHYWDNERKEWSRQTDFWMEDIA